jgi:hypothetical protein
MILPFILAGERKSRLIGPHIRLWSLQTLSSDSGRTTRANRKQSSCLRVGSAQKSRFDSGDKVHSPGCDAHFCLKEGFAFGICAGTQLYTKCARIKRFQFIGVSS